MTHDDLDNRPTMLVELLADLMRARFEALGRGDHTEDMIEDEIVRVELLIGRYGPHSFVHDTCETPPPA